MLFRSWAADALLAVPRRRMSIEAAPPAVIHIGEPEPLVLTVRAAGWKRPVPVDVVVDLDDDFDRVPGQRVILRPEGRPHADEPAGPGPIDEATRVEVTLTPRRRGELVGPSRSFSRALATVCGGRACVPTRVGGRVGNAYTRAL